MPEHIYEIEPVMQRAVELLKQLGRPVTTGLVCVELQLPFYAVGAALDRAQGEGLVEFTAGVGWTVREVVPDRVDCGDCPAPNGCSVRCMKAGGRQDGLEV